MSCRYDPKRLRALTVFFYDRIARIEQMIDTALEHADFDMEYAHFDCELDAALTMTGSTRTIDDIVCNGAIIHAGM